MTIQHIEQQLAENTAQQEPLQQQLTELKSQRQTLIEQWWHEKHNLHKGDKVRLLTSLEGSHYIGWNEWDHSREFDPGEMFIISHFDDIDSVCLDGFEEDNNDSIYDVLPHQIERTD